MFVVRLYTIALINFEISRGTTHQMQNGYFSSFLNLKEVFKMYTFKDYLLEFINMT